MFNCYVILILNFFWVWCLVPEHTIWLLLDWAKCIIMFGGGVLCLNLIMANVFWVWSFDGPPCRTRVNWKQPFWFCKGEVTLPSWGNRMLVVGYHNIGGSMLFFLLHMYLTIVSLYLVAASLCWRCIWLLIILLHMQDLHQRAIFETDKAMLTDAPLLFPPGQVFFCIKDNCCTAYDNIPISYDELLSQCFLTLWEL